VVFLGCWGASTACTGSGKIARHHGEVCILAINVKQLLSWKQLLHMIFGYGDGPHGRPDLNL
jgi:hypothetical protein